MPPMPCVFALLMDQAFRKRPFSMANVVELGDCGDHYSRQFGPISYLHMRKAM